MRCADGGVRRVHPILAAHIGDWPELCTAGCTQITRCPTCISKFQDRGSLGAPARLRTKIETLEALRLNRRGYADMRVGLGLRPVWPYWGNHPYSNGPSLFLPDLLHQLWKGVYLTHLVPWWTRLLGPDKLDQRFIGAPRFSGQRNFSSGISVLTQWTGNEARATAQVFLPLIAGETPRKAVQAARCVIDFTYRARLPQLDEDDLATVEIRVQRHRQTTHAPPLPASNSGNGSTRWIQYRRAGASTYRNVGKPGYTCVRNSNGRELFRSGNGEVGQRRSRLLRMAIGRTILTRRK